MKEAKLVFGVAAIASIAAASIGTTSCGGDESSSSTSSASGGSSGDASSGGSSSGGSSGGSSSGTSASGGTGGPAKKRVFVTAKAFTGDPGGLASADFKCKTEAGDAMLTTSTQWVAWLSTSSANAPDRVDAKRGKDVVWHRTGDDAKVATGDELSSGALLEAISQNAKGETLAAKADGSDNVWTGTGADGAVKTGEVCGGWTSSSSAASGTWGAYAEKDAKWTDLAKETCEKTAHLYCFEK